MPAQDARDFEDASGPEPGLIPPAVPRPPRGRLTLFLGMAPGVGKTCAMLQAAQAEKQRGRDVVVAQVETHSGKFAENLLRGLPQIPPRRVASAPDTILELDRAALLTRQPHLVIVDELAQGNPPGARRAQRSEEILDLLAAGCDVFATLNIYEVASRAVAAEKITGMAVRQTVPDRLVDEAAIEFVNLIPGKLLQRISDGQVSAARHPDFAHANFFQEGKLLALHEMTWRLAANRASREANAFIRENQLPSGSGWGHRLIAGVGPGPEGDHVVRAAKLLADSLNCPWLALYVERPNALATAAEGAVTRHLDLARALGAEVVTTTDHDVVQGLLRVATERHATQLVIGNPRPAIAWSPFRRDRMVGRLLRAGSEKVIHAVPCGTPGKSPPRSGHPKSAPAPLRQYGLVAIVIGAITIGAAFLAPIIGVHSAALLYLLGVVLLALFVNRGPTLLAAALSALFWDYFILPPAFAFRIQHFEDAMLLGMYFVVAIVLGQLTARIRAQQEAERRREARATALYVLTRELAEETDRDKMLHNIVRELGGVFQARVAVLLADPTGNLQSPHPASNVSLSAADRTTATWVFRHNQWAGKFIDPQPGVEVLWVPLTSAGGVVGVLGLNLAQMEPPTVHQRNLLETFARQIALALDRDRLQASSEQARLLAESERLAKTMLDGIAHEIRTPLAAIHGAAGNLAQFAETGQSERQRLMIAEIQEATNRLNRLVGNVLDITRLDSGSVKPKFNECDVQDLVNVAVAETESQLVQHPLTVNLAPGLPVVTMDFVLTQQALMNLLVNAAVHTPPGTPIELTARMERPLLIFEVADRGPGIPAASLAQVFDKFYRGPKAPTGGTGLGLSLVKGFVEAQGGHVKVANRRRGGVAFTIALPLERPFPTGVNL